MIRGHTNSINSVCFDPIGKLLASCSSDLSIKLWKFDNPLKCLKTLNGHEHLVSSIEFSPDSNTLFSASRDKTIKVWEVSSGACKTTLKGHEEWVRSLSLNEKGSLLASTSDDESTIVWATDQMIQRYTFTGHENKIEQVLFVNLEAAKNNIYTSDYVDGNSQSDQQTSEIKSEQQDKLNQITRKIADQNKLSKKIEKEYLLTCSRDKTIKLFDVYAGNCIYTFAGHDNWVRCMAIHPSGKYLITTGDDRSIRVWDLKSGRCMKKLERVHEKFIVTLAIHNKLNLLVTGSNDLNIKFFECN